MSEILDRVITMANYLAQEALKNVFCNHSSRSPIIKMQTAIAMSCKVASAQQDQVQLPSELQHLQVSLQLLVAQIAMWQALEQQAWLSKIRVALEVANRQKSMALLAVQRLKTCSTRSVMDL